MFLLASHSCETLPEYVGVAIPTELSRNGNVKWQWSGKARWQAGGKVTQVIAS
jgi:hypothetical protein